MTTTFKLYKISFSSQHGNRLSTNALNTLYTIWSLESITRFTLNDSKINKLFLKTTSVAKFSSRKRGWWNGVHVRAELRGTLVRAKAIAKANIYLWFGLFSLFGTCTYLYGYSYTRTDLSTCTYQTWFYMSMNRVRDVRWNDLNVMHVHGPCFNAPIKKMKNKNDPFFAR